MKEHSENFYSLEELKRARDCYDGYQDGEEVFYFVGALRYACDEIERLNHLLEDIKTHLESYDYDNMPLDARVLATNISLIIDGTIKVVRGEENE